MTAKYLANAIDGLAADIAETHPYQAQALRRDHEAADERPHARPRFLDPAPAGVSEKEPSSARARSKTAPVSRR